jgi:hypothetical protein
MEISPIREIRAPAVAGAVKAESEVQAPHPPMRTRRMEDDGYRGNDQAPGRGLEDEEPEDISDPGEGEESIEGHGMDPSDDPFNQRAAESDISDSESKFDRFA